MTKAEFATATPEERYRRFVAELDAVDAMSPVQRRAEVRRITGQGGTLAIIAAAALAATRDKN